MKHLITYSFFLFIISCTSNYNYKYTKDNFGSESAPNTYTVKKGDSLFAIAWRFGLDQKTIQKSNRLSNPNKIFIGQKLRLSAKPEVAKNTQKSSPRKTRAPRKTQAVSYSSKGWVWPLKGRVIRRFNAKRIGANGVRLAGKPNQTVNASQSGVVAYQGNGLNGYGNVIIIKHSNGLLSAYGFLSKTYVKEGQHIKKRQKIGTVGYSSKKTLALHFEIRKKGKPVNPKKYIGSHYHF